MLFRLKFLVPCAVLASSILQIILCEDVRLKWENKQKKEENMGWPIDYEFNSKTLPSIEVKLSPPENGMMQKLEDEYNKSLSSSKIKIQDTVEKSLSIFNDPNMLGSVISNSVKTLRRENLRKIPENIPAKNNLKKLQKVNQATSGPLPPPELRKHTSFLEQNYVNRTLPSVKISLSELTEPSVEIKEKMEEMEQYRTDEEVAMFEMALSEFSILTDITILELEKQIQLQLNPFLVDKKVVHRALTKELKELGQREEKQMIKVENFQRQTSFIEEGENEDTGNILNVKISQTDYGYPTIDELVMHMQKRRDISEKLERQKILDLQMKLLKAQSEMIKDALHFALSKVIAQYSPVVETMKLESLRML
eukprot:XP_002260582.1 blood-stage antigen 41-3, putative [Plasmodium knowlesi strain H]